MIDFDERAFAPSLQPFLADCGYPHVDAGALWNTWLDTARERARRQGRDPERPLEGPEPLFQPFSHHWSRNFERAFAGHGVDRIHPQQAVRHLFHLLSRAPAYPEVAGVFTALRAAGVRVAVASNADNVHLHSALETACIKADVVLSSEAVRSYKPRRPFFDALLARLGLPPDRVLYVGDSPTADLIGARHAGLATYWVRRFDPATVPVAALDDRAPAVPAPTWTFPDLLGLLDVLGVRGA